MLPKVNWLVGLAAAAAVAGVFQYGYLTGKRVERARLTEAFRAEKAAAVDAQAELCRHNNRITESTDHALQQNLDDLTRRYHALLVRAGGRPACVSTARGPAGDHAAAGDRAAGAGAVDPGAVLRLGYDGDRNGEALRACQDFVRKIYGRAAGQERIAP